MRLLLASLFKTTEKNGRAHTHTLGDSICTVENKENINFTVSLQLNKLNRMTATEDLKQVRVHARFGSATRLTEKI